MGEWRVNEALSATLEGYEAAQDSAALYAIPDAGYLHISGPDRLDFVQRQTTNDIRRLKDDGTLLTVLTNATARILDVWRVLVEPGDTLGVITLAGRGAATTAYLRSRIFFMDKVTVADQSAAVAQVALIGPDAADALHELGWRAIPAVGRVAVLDLDGRAARAFAHGLGWRLLIPAVAREAFQARVAQAGIASLNAAAYAVLRVEAGQPGVQSELTDAHTPLETNLDAAISGDKGCYTGQEIIARQITYDKVTRRMVGLRLAGPVPVGERITVEGRSAGEVTSVVESPRLGWLALAIVKRPHFEPGTPVEVGEQASTVAALPFV